MDKVCIARHIIMYRDLNPHGSLYGGRLLEWIDEAAAMYARSQLDSSSMLTLKVSELLFRSPGRLGDFLEFYCRPIRFGTTSLTISVDVVNQNTHAKIVSCEIVMVNVGEDGKPKAHGKTTAKPLNAWRGK